MNKLETSLILFLFKSNFIKVLFNFNPLENLFIFFISLFDKSNICKVVLFFNTS